MIKVAADMSSKAQHKAIGILSITGSAVGGATVTGAVGGATGVVATMTSGCVLDIFADVGLGGSGNTLMRAVSLASGVVAGDVRAGAAGAAAGAAVTSSGGLATAGAGAVSADPIGRGKGVLAPGRGGGVSVLGGGGAGTNA